MISSGDIPSFGRYRPVRLHRPHRRRSSRPHSTAREKQPRITLSSRFTLDCDLFRAQRFPALDMEGGYFVEPPVADRLEESLENTAVFEE